MDREISLIDFANIKKQILHDVDISKKGSIDEPILTLLDKLNSLEDFVTTSSCSGRIIITSQNTTEIQKKNCNWLFSSHSLIEEDKFHQSLDEAHGYLTLKFEPFILHVRARTLESAKALLNVGLTTGFKNSGIVIGKHGKITIAIRSTSNLEVPLTDGEKLIVSSDFLKHCISILNRKMIKNFESIKKFEEGLRIIKCNVDFWSVKQGNIPREEFLRRIVGKDALIVCSHDRIDDEVLAAAGPSLKVISSVSVGVDHVDLNSIKKYSVKLGHTPGVLTEAVAELTLALLLATSRRIIESNKTISLNQWKWTPTWMCGTGLSGSTVGIIGFGRIGQSVAKKLLAFDVSRILYTGPRKKSEGDAYNAEFSSLDDLLKKSDIVIVLCPLTHETKGIFTRDKFSLMKRSSIFINTARGGIVDQDALIYALENKLIRAAGLDVMSPEPLPSDHLLVKLENCVLTPHIGSATIETRNDMCNLAVDNVLSVFDEKPMPAEYKV